MYDEHHSERNNRFEAGDWLTDKDILCWLNQEVRHNEIDKPRAWTLALLYLKRLSKYPPPPCKVPPLAISPPPPWETVTSMFF